MAYPDLYKDEQKILETQNIKVKSVSFTAVLTNRRLVLIDGKKGMLPPQEILLATLKNVESGENAIRDPTITLSILTSTGTTRQMILTFSKTAGGERKRECDDWVKALRQFVTTTIEHPVLPDIPSLDETTTPPPVENIPVPPPHPKIEIVSTPQQKKRIEISRPMKKIVESAPAMPAPVETTSLPVGSFCNRCGSRVPPESAFCNRCGTPVVKEGDIETVLAQPPATPAPPVVSPMVEVSHVPDTPVSEPVAPAHEVPQVAVPMPPVFGQAADRKERPIEQVIHSIEPLIEDSVPRTEPAPLIPRPVAMQLPEQQTSPTEPQPAEQPEEVRWPVIKPLTPPPEAVSPQHDAPTPQVSSRGESGKKGWLTYAIAGIVIIAIIAAIVIFANPFGQTGVPAQPTPTPVPTATAIIPATITTTVVPTGTVTTAEPVVTPTVAATVVPSASIPDTGVWVRITYANQFSGTVGTPNAQRDVSATGEKVYQISTSTGTVQAIIQKDDGSGERLIVEIFKDGDLVTSKSTTAPKGIVEIQVSLKPSPTPTPVVTLLTVTPDVTTLSSENITANATAGN